MICSTLLPQRQVALSAPETSDGEYVDIAARSAALALIIPIMYDILNSLCSERRTDAALTCLGLRHLRCAKASRLYLVEATQARCHMVLKSDNSNPHDFALAGVKTRGADVWC